MLYNESPVCDYSVVTPILNYGSFCWGAVLGVCEPPALSASLRSHEVPLWRLLAEQIVLDHPTSCSGDWNPEIQVFSEESLEEYWAH